MTWKSSGLLAYRLLSGGRSRRRPGRRSRLQGGIIGVAVSLIPLVIVLQVANGMIAGITERFIEAGSSHLQAVSRGEPDEAQVMAAVEALRSREEFIQVSVERQGLGLAAAGTNRTGVTIRAVDPDLWDDDAGLRKYVEFSQGSWDLSTPNSILLGRYVARELGANVGDRVTLLTARSLSGDRFLPRSSSFTVEGILSTGYADLDRLWVLIPYDRGLRVIPDESARVLIGAKVEDPLVFPNPLFGPRETESGYSTQDASETIGDLRQQLGAEWRILSWFDAERAKYMSFETTKDLLIFIMVLIVIVAAVNIASALIMLVLEKQEEIAILKSLGASPRGIRRSFLIAGFGLGAIGTAVGLSLGVVLALGINQILAALEWLANAAVSVALFVTRPITGVEHVPFELLSGEYYLETIPVAIDPGELLLIAILTLLLATAAAYLPARRASRIRPLEVLRKH